MVKFELYLRKLIIQAFETCVLVTIVINRLNGGESSSQFRWFTMAKIEL